MSDNTQNATAMMRYDANKRSAGIAYALWFFFGWFGAHRFYLRRTGSAVVMLITFILSFITAFIAIGFAGFIILGLWAFVDAFLIPGMTRDYNNRLITNMVV